MKNKPVYDALLRKQVMHSHPLAAQFPNQSKAPTVYGGISKSDADLVYQKRVFTTVGLSGADYLVTGSADQTQTNTAITAVSAAGGGIVFLKDPLNITAPILLKSNVALMGAGVGKTIVRGSSGDFALITMTQNGQSKTSYSNISIIGISFLSQYGHCSQLQNATNLSVEDCEFWFTAFNAIRESLFIQHCQYVNVTNNYLHDLTGDGVQINGTDHFVVTDNIINGNLRSDDAIDIDKDFVDTKTVQSNYGVVANNTIRNVSNGNCIRVAASNWINVIGNNINGLTDGSAAGILVNDYSDVQGSNSTSHVLVANNSISNCLTDGIRTQGDSVTDVLIQGNRLDTCGQTGGSNIRSGIQLNSPGVKVAGNFLDNCGKAGGDSAAIIVFKKNGSRITNNTIINSTTGIRTWNGDAAQSYTDTIVKDNDFSNNGTDIILDALTTGISSNYNGTAGIETISTSTDQTRTDLVARTITQKTASVGVYINKTFDGGTSRQALLIDDANTTAGNQTVRINSNRGAGVEAVRILQNGAANGLYVDQVGNGIPIYIQNEGTNNSFQIQGTTTTDLVVKKSGNTGLGVASPTAILQLKAGTAAANTAPFKLTSGANLTSPEAGAVEFDGTLLYYTDSNPTRQTIATKAYVDAQVGGDVTSITGTANQVIASAATGAVTLSLPQSIATGSSPTFNALTLSTALTVGNGGTGSTTASGARTNLGAVNIAGDTMTGALTIARTAATSGIPKLLVLTAPTDTGLTVTEFNDVSFNLSASRQFTTGGGTIAQQRSVYIQAPTYTANTNAVTITRASTVYISGPPIAGSNVTMTHAFPLIVASGNVGLGTDNPFVELHIKNTDARIDLERTDNLHTCVMNFLPTGALTATNVEWSMGLTTSDNTFRFAFYDGTSTTNVFRITNASAVEFISKITTYNNIATAGWGLPAIYGSGRSTAQTTAVTSVATYTVGAVDGSFLVSANVNVTTSSAENFTVTCAYTDETNTVRTLTFNFSLLAGTLGTAIAFANGAVPYEGLPMHIRCKAATAITIKTTGTFTGATYNVEGYITQIG